MIRFYPVKVSRKSSSKLSIKDIKTFEFIWRGRETGEGEIQIDSDKNTYEITFDNHGTTFKATFGCDYVRNLTLKGTKLSHGYGKLRSSARRWNGLSERAHDRESRSRWGGGW